MARPTPPRWVAQSTQKYQVISHVARGLERSEKPNQHHSDSDSLSYSYLSHVQKLKKFTLHILSLLKRAKCLPCGSDRMVDRKAKRSKTPYYSLQHLASCTSHGYKPPFPCSHPDVLMSMSILVVAPVKRLIACICSHARHVSSCVIMKASRPPKLLSKRNVARLEESPRKLDDHPPKLLILKAAQESIKPVPELRLSRIKATVEARRHAL